MTYKVTIFSQNMFEDEINDIFKQIGDEPKIDVCVDFHDKIFFDLYHRSIFSNYIQKVMPANLNNYINTIILEKLLQKKPFLNEEVEKIKLSLKDEQEDICKEFEEKILPLPDRGE